MNLREFMKGMNDIIDQNPDALEYVVVFEDAAGSFPEVPILPYTGRVDDRLLSFDEYSDKPNAVGVV